MCNPYHAAFGLGVFFKAVSDKSTNFIHRSNTTSEGQMGSRETLTFQFRFPRDWPIDFHLPEKSITVNEYCISSKDKSVLADLDNITVSYGHQLSPIEPFSSLFDYQKYRDPRLRIPRTKREIQYSQVTFIVNFFLNAHITAINEMHEGITLRGRMVACHTFISIPKRK